MSEISPEQRRELGDFIRTCREKLTPEAIGLPSGGRRRTPGLRREEVAQLSGLSTTWYTWIEQGRDVSASPWALARLAAALRLGRAERAYLFEIAGKRDPDHAGTDADGFPEVLRASVECISGPAYVLDRQWNAQSWNEAAERLFVGWLNRPGGGDRNLLRYIFLEPVARTLIRDWEMRAQRVVAEFRAAASLYLDDAELRALVEELHRNSADFARLWDRHGVLDREGGLRTFDHPTDGFLQFEQVTFDLAGRPDFKLTMLVPRSGEEDGAG